MKKKNITQFQTKLKKREDMKRQSHDVTTPKPLISLPALAFIEGIVIGAMITGWFLGV